MKKSILLTLAALAILFTQCKKTDTINPSSQPTDDGQVSITLNVGGNSKVDVNPSNGIVSFESGDVIYVASDGKYVGTLTHNGTVFEGPISNPKEGEPLYFYFLGNKCTTAELTAGVTTELTADISDQSSKLPVISCAPSTVNYSSEVTSYSAKLLNKCGLVKFTTSDYTGSGNLSVKKMNNKVTINLANQSFNYGKVTDDGVITLNKVSDGTYWAILLPQVSVTGGTAGDAYSSDSWIGIYGTIPAITANSYITAGVSITNSSYTPHAYVDLGLPSGLLWATCNVGAENPEDYGDYFAWGETEPKSNYDWSTYQWCNGSSTTLTKYCTNSEYGYNGFVDNKTELEMSDDAAHANWGDDWRMPTTAEWEELYEETEREWVSTDVSGCKFKNKTDASKYIFLPAAGRRYGTSFDNVSSYGFYWSSLLHSDAPYYACNQHFNSYDFGSPYNGYPRYYGLSVRPVRHPQK